MNNLLNIIFVYVLYIFIFSFIYIFTWGVVRNYFVRFTIYYQAIIGGVFAILSIIAQGLIPVFILTNNDEKIMVAAINIFLPLIICWILVVFISWIAVPLYIGIIIIFLFGVAPEFNNSYYLLLTNMIDIVSLVALYIIVVIIAVAGWYFKLTKWTMWSLLTLISFVTVSIIVLSQYSKTTASENLISELFVLIWIAMSYLAYSICAITELIYVHALKLQNIIEYDRTTYIREALAHDAIYDIVQRNKIRKGLYLTFMINNINKLDKIMSTTVKDKIIDIVSRQAFNAWKERDVLFFKASLNHFGIFVPLIQSEKLDLNILEQHNRSEIRPMEDTLKDFETLLNKINTTFVLRNYKIIVKIQGYASIYGIQSNNLDKLKEYNIASADNRLTIEYANKVLFVDPGNLKELSNQKRSVLALNESIQLDKILSLFSPVINVQSNYQLNGHYATNFINGNDIDSVYGEEAKKLVGGSTYEIILSRFNAALNIKNFHKLVSKSLQKVFISYSASFVATEQFNFKKFVTKLIELKVKPASLIITFDLIEDGFDLEKLENVVKQLKTLGIQIAVKNLGANGTDLGSLAYYTPDYAILAPLIVREMFIRSQYQILIKEFVSLAKKLDFILIAPHVNSYLGYSKLKELKIDYMFGALFGIYEKPQETISNEIKFALLKNERKGIKNAIKK